MKIDEISNDILEGLKPGQWANNKSHTEAILKKYLSSSQNMTNTTAKKRSSLKEATIQVIDGEDFIQMLKDAVLDASFVDIMKATGLDSVPLDKHAAKYILGVSADSSIEKYCKVGKQDNMRVTHKLKCFYQDNNKPRYKLIDVLEFKRIK